MGYAASIIARMQHIPSDNNDAAMFPVVGLSVHCTL
jgi:hypothetical protein